MSDDGRASLNASASFVGHAALHFYIAAFSLEVVFFTAFVGTFSYGTWILCRAHPQTRRQRWNVALFAANVVMFLMALTHLLLDIYGASRGFPEPRAGIEAAKFLLYVSQTLIGDGFMIYRLYRVFDRSWTIAVLPTILLLLDTVIGYTSAFVGVVGFYMSVAFYGISLVINIICTVCIMWRVYYLTREFSEVNSKLKIWKVIEATVQSTAIYSAAAISLVITFVNSTELGYPTCLNIFPSLLGLVFSFVVIRVAHNSARDSSRPNSNYTSSAGRNTYPSHTPILEHHDRALMRQVYAAEPLEPAQHDGAAARALSGVLHISEIKTSSDDSITPPRLESHETTSLV